MTNAIFFYQADRDYWSESTSASETPRRSSEEDGPDSKASGSSSTVIEAAAHVQPNPGEELKSFNFDELKRATNDFHVINIVGKGGFGRVFKGWIDDSKLIASKPGRGLTVAIKMLSRESKPSPGERLTELKYLKKLIHPNLVRLLGHCCDDEQLLLVYEFLPLGSFDHQLFESGPSDSLSWNLRMKVAHGAAKGLAFVHSANCIFGDFKASNVLLDSDYNAKLYGSILTMDDLMKYDISDPLVRPDYNCAAPEYNEKGDLNSRCDVYGFGVFLLEILCGQRAIDRNRPSGEQNLLELAKPYLMHTHKEMHILDRRLEGQLSPKVVRSAANIVLICTARQPKSRPTMDQVVELLVQLAEDGKEIQIDQST